LDSNFDKDNWRIAVPSKKDGWPLKRGSIYMKCNMTGTEKGDLLIQVTAY
jgi:hypothetical protein